MSEWISVKDQLPPESELVLIHRKNAPMTVDYIVLFSDGPIWGCLLQDEWENVTHWMPLPPEPK